MDPRSDITSAGAIDPESLLAIGRIWRPHGVHGEVKIIPESDDPDRLHGLDTLYLGTDRERARPYTVESMRLQQTKKGINVIVGFEGVEGRDEAEGLRKLDVYAAQEDLPPLEEDEYFVHDVVGLEVVTEDGETLGHVVDVLPTPAHDVFVVARSGRPDAMVPAVDEFVLDVDLDAKRVTIRPIEGLLD